MRADFAFPRKCHNYEIFPTICTCDRMLLPGEKNWLVKSIGAHSVYKKVIGDVLSASITMKCTHP